jgi:DNA invertase Pin-like site-specific DNA recombinase
MTKRQRPRPLALAYTRVSTLDQAENGVSLDAQEAMLREHAKVQGWDIEVLREEGKSAKSLKGRPILLGALARLDRSEADILLAVRLDRLSRSLIDFASLYERSDKKGWSIVLPASAIDTSASAGPAGKFSAQIQAAAAELERGLISVRTREALAQRKAEGKRLGRAVLEEFLPTYQRVLDMHAEGLSLNAIARTLNDEGVPTAKGKSWYASTVRTIVTSETARELRPMADAD